MRVPAGPDAHRRHVPSAECLLRTLCHRRLCSYLLSSCASSSSRKGQRQVKLCTRKWVVLIVLALVIIVRLSAIRARAAGRDGGRVLRGVGTGSGDSGGRLSNFLCADVLRLRRGGVGGRAVRVTSSG